MVPAFIGESHFAFLGYSLAFSLTPMRRELDYLRDLGTKKESAKELKVFGLGQYLRDRFARINDEVVDRNKKLLRRRVIAGSLLAVLSSVGYYGSYAYLVMRALRGRVEFRRSDVSGGRAAGHQQPDPAHLLHLHQHCRSGSCSSPICFSFSPLSRTSERRGRALPAPTPDPRAASNSENVSFHYPGVGASGPEPFGFSHRPRRADRACGRERPGKDDVSEAHLAAVRSHGGPDTSGRDSTCATTIWTSLQHEIGVIFQDFVRYDMTARENIGVGRIEYLGDESRLMDAAQKSRASDILERLPGRLDQMLGRRFEGGVDLSGGEWQKFALARAYARDAQLLILDEPTAALDAPSEYEIFLRFAELTEGKMALLDLSSFLHRAHVRPYRRPRSGPDPRRGHAPTADRQRRPVCGHV